MIVLKEIVFLPLFEKLFAMWFRDGIQKGQQKALLNVYDA